MSEDVMKPQSVEPTGTPAASKIKEHQERRNRLAKTTQVIWLVTSILEVLIGIRVLLRLMAANPEAGFARFIYGMTNVFLVPFAALLPNPSANGFVLELSSLMGMLVYALLAWGIVRIMWVVFEQPPESGGPGAIT
jgi:hypothetical protein